MTWHTHSELALVQDGDAHSKIRQGVALDVLGERSTVVPRDGLGREGNDRSDVVQDWS